MDETNAKIWCMKVDWFHWLTQKHSTGLASCPSFFPHPDPYPAPCLLDSFTVSKLSLNTRQLVCCEDCARDCQWPFKSIRNSHRLHDPTMHCSLHPNPLQMRLSLLYTPTSQSHETVSQSSCLPWGFGSWPGLTWDPLISSLHHVLRPPHCQMEFKLSADYPSSVWHMSGCCIHVWMRDWHQNGIIFTFSSLAPLQVVKIISGAASDYNFAHLQTNFN